MCNFGWGNSLKMSVSGSILKSLPRVKSFFCGSVFVNVVGSWLRNNEVHTSTCTEGMTFLF